MRDETDKWLGPLVEAAADAVPLGERQALLRQATMPLADGHPLSKVLEDVLLDGATVRGVDWVQFGYLLRHRLGWDESYPDYPGSGHVSSSG